MQIDTMAAPGTTEAGTPCAGLAALALGAVRVPSPAALATR